MGTNDVNMLLGALREAKEEHSKQLTAIFAKLNAIHAEGCAKYPDHAKAQAELLDHGKRLSVLESDKKAVVWLGTIFGGTAGLIVTWLKK